MEENAILMAAGLGSRMRPLTEHTPKPLIQILGKPMIETVIEGLIERQVKHIYVVTGYLKEQFDYLTEKYQNIELIHNPYFESRNNISSIYVARDVLAMGPCFICESDLYVRDASIFRKNLIKSCYYGCVKPGYSDDWVFDMENGRITRVGKGGEDSYNMVGVSYFTEKDALLLKEKIEEAFVLECNSDLFWDEVVNANLDVLDMKVEPVEPGQLLEIDTVEELNAVNRKG